MAKLLFTPLAPAFSTDWRKGHGKGKGKGKGHGRSKSRSRRSRGSKH